MRVVRPRRARLARALLALIGGSALLGGCGSSTSFTPGTPVVTMGNASSVSDFAAYIVVVSGITLTEANGTIATPLVTPESIDLVKLSTQSELVEAPAVPAGTYTSATITLDYSSASIWANVDGQAVALTPQGIGGATYAGVTVTVNFDPNNPLVIAQGESVRLQIALDPAASNSIISSSVVLVQPFIVVSPAPVDSTVMRARGLFVVSQPNLSNFIMNIRPFYDLVSALGAVTVNTNAQTYFNINGTVYVGAAGLNALTTQQENFPLAAYGTLDSLSGITPSFNATAVYVGASLESPVAEYVSGVVSARVGDVVNVRGATFLSPLGVEEFFNDLPVALGPGTLVTQDNVAAQNLGIDSVSVGQEITVAGQQTVDAAGNVTGLDAAQGGLLRLNPTPVWGTLNALPAATTGQAFLDVLTIGNYATAGFNFAGTGSGGTQANPAAYEVSTPAPGASGLGANTLLQAAGTVSPFGTAPPNFTASVLTQGTDTTQQLLVEWSDLGATEPFIQPISSTGITVNLANPAVGAYHYIRTGPAILDLKALPASPLITTVGADQSNLQLAVGSATVGISVFNSAAGFTTKLSSLFTPTNTTNKLYRLVAYGHYNPCVATGPSSCASGTNTFVASRIDAALHE
ncbi:MAG TPA: hypothetical protein VGP32_10710 [Steroidobacteraceae bacterium]|jgi:hypothetical protein|nr:hypothetical protein [Steroidobacteraceae bacterium]